MEVARTSFSTPPGKMWQPRRAEPEPRASELRVPLARTGRGQLAQLALTLKRAVRAPSHNLTPTIQLMLSARVSKSGWRSSIHALPNLSQEETPRLQNIRDILGMISLQYRPSRIRSIRTPPLGTVTSPHRRNSTKIIKLIQIFLSIKFTTRKRLV
jgi:hypothetical protein